LNNISPFILLFKEIAFRAALNCLCIDSSSSSLKSSNLDSSVFSGIVFFFNEISLFKGFGILNFLILIFFSF
jgi:hypothetical protein